MTACSLYSNFTHCSVPTIRQKYTLYINRKPLVHSQQTTQIMDTVIPILFGTLSMEMAEHTTQRPLREQRKNNKRKNYLCAQFWDARSSRQKTTRPNVFSNKIKETFQSSGRPPLYTVHPFNRPHFAQAQRNTADRELTRSAGLQGDRRRQKTERILLQFESASFRRKRSGQFRLERG